MIEERKKAIISEKMGEKNFGRKDLEGRDLLSLLLKANLATDIPASQKPGDDVVGVCGWGRDEVAKPVRVHEEVSIPREPVLDELRPAELGDDRRLLERLPDTEYALAPEYPTRMRVEKLNTSRSDMNTAG